jgi:DNA gyrase subunit A
LKGIRVTGRVTQGVILTKIKWEGDVLMRASIVRQNDEEEI